VADADVWTSWNHLLIDALRERRDRVGHCFWLLRRHRVTCVGQHDTVTRSPSKFSSTCENRRGATASFSPISGAVDRFAHTDTKRMIAARACFLEVVTQLNLLFEAGYDMTTNR